MQNIWIKAGHLSPVALQYLRDVDFAGRERWLPGKKAGIVTQTTLATETLAEVVGIFVRKPFNELRVFNTICNASIERQKSVRDLAGRVDVMFVLGGYNSANTSRLAELSRQAGVETHHLETARALKPDWLRGVRSVGIAAGASTPQWIIDEFVEETARLGRLVNGSPDAKH